MRLDVIQTQHPTFDFFVQNVVYGRVGDESTFYKALNVVHEELDLSYRKNKRDLSPDGPFPNGLFDYDPSIGNDI